jgi:hypothetical protein
MVLTVNGTIILSYRTLFDKRRVYHNRFSSNLLEGSRPAVRSPTAMFVNQDYLGFPKTSRSR